MHTAEDLVSGVGNLASLPAVYQQVKEIVDDPNSSVMDLSKVVSADPALTARLLHVVNSVYFGLMSRVETVSHACSLLGMLQVHDIVLATSITAVFKGIRPSHMDMTRYWSNSVMRGLIARTAAETCDTSYSERLFVEGLLADIGHLVMYQTVPQEAERALLRAQAEGRALHRVEKEMIGCSYAEVGAALTAKWKLPERFSAAIEFQVNPAQAGELYGFEAALLHLALVMVEGMNRSLENEKIARAVDPYVWQVTDLKPASVASIRTVAEMNHAEVVALFFPGLKVAA